ncbi:MAG: hypothetical protein AB7O88_02360 [Reyranellaceae bacterium]
MIPVKCATEPTGFDADVRKPGLRFLKTVHHPKSKDFKNKEFWRKSIPDLLVAYNRVCAYTAFRIARTTGAATVDHFVPVDEDCTLAYEWTNFRLACWKVNSRKGKKKVLDPFTIPDNVFTIRFPSLLVAPSDSLPREVMEQAQDTIATLKLNDEELVTTRQEYIDLWCNKDVPFDFVRREAPFLAAEIERQGVLGTLCDQFS